MSARSLPITAAACAVAAAMMLAACSGGEDKPKDDKIAGAESSDTSTPSASPTADGARPNTELPEDLRMVFEWNKTGKPAADAVFADAEQYFRGLKRASVNHDLKDPAYSFYSRDEGLSYAIKQIKLNIEGGLAPTGTDRYFNGKVAVFEKGSAGLVTCRDQSKLYSKNTKSGKVEKTDPKDERNFVLYNLGLRKDPKGVWKVSDVSVTVGAQECGA
ncbi:hypothetical protein [Streptomyces sp. 8N616]|uniref:hypothetical protein n=1 Tax=Streptomyces sp. 8N616 TaxID=3457414 RepID=UPI003FCF3252